MFSTVGTIGIYACGDGGYEVCETGSPLALDNG